MAVRKICTEKGCRASPRCEHPWWFDLMHQGKRWRMSVDRFAFARGAAERIEAKRSRPPSEFGNRGCLARSRRGETHACRPRRSEPPWV